MELKEIEGKKYVEYDEYKVNRNAAIRQMIFLILIAITVGFLIVGIIEIKTNAEMLQKPLQYNLDRFNIKDCYCRNWDDTTFTVVSNKINITQ